MTEEEQKQRFSPAPLDATTSCSDYASALKVHGNLTDAEIDQIEKKHPQTKSYDVSKEIVPRINYLKFLEERDRLGDEEAKEVSASYFHFEFSPSPRSFCTLTQSFVSLFLREYSLSFDNRNASNASLKSYTKT